MATPRPAPANTVGITHISDYDDLVDEQHQRQQLMAAAVDYAEREIPEIAGTGGAAVVVSYQSPKTGAPVTVLIVPGRVQVDQYAERYYYLSGMTAEAAAEADWVAVYDATHVLHST